MTTRGRCGHQLDLTAGGLPVRVCAPTRIPFLEGGSAVALFPLEKFRAPPEGFQALVSGLYQLPSRHSFQGSANPKGLV